MRRLSSKIEWQRAAGVAFLGAFLALPGSGAHAQKPPPPPKPGKIYPQAKDDRTPPARVIRLNPGQKKIDPKLLKTAPTVAQYVKAQAKQPRPRPVQRQISPAPPLPVGKSTGIVRPLPPARPVRPPAKAKR